MVRQQPTSWKPGPTPVKYSTIWAKPCLDPADGYLTANRLSLDGVKLGSNAGSTFLRKDAGKASQAHRALTGSALQQPHIQHPHVLARLVCHVFTRTSPRLLTLPGIASWPTTTSQMASTSVGSFSMSSQIRRFLSSCRDAMSLSGACVFNLLQTAGFCGHPSPAYPDEFKPTSTFPT